MQKSGVNASVQVLAVMATVFAGVLSGACAAQATATPEPPLPKVRVVAARAQSVPLEASFTGRIEAVHAVELRPRVSGALEEILFREGAYVSKGTPLFVIDKRPYEIARRRAEADVAAVAAQLTRAREEAQRGERLALSDAVSIEELERRRAEVAALEARLELARAAEQEALLHLDFTTVSAPVSGRIGRAEVTKGNLVNGTPGAGTRLAVLHSIDPIYAYFELDPVTAGAAMPHGQSRWVASVSSFDGNSRAEGPIDFVDNGVGPQTGTLKVRARLENPEGRFVPGAVVKVSFRFGTLPTATVVPEIAIGTDQGTRFVHVAASDGTVEYRPVSLASKAGAWRVVDDSIKPGELIVLPGLPGLRPGIKVATEQEVLR
ncbi:MAG TPA: efflux RND transporter periplasmic adaptor subunit [Vicinamibacterales bacterium]